MELQTPDPLQQLEHDAATAPRKRTMLQRTPTWLLVVLFVMSCALLFGLAYYAYVLTKSAGERVVQEVYDVVKDAANIDVSDQAGIVDPRQGWQTYTSTERGFSFMHPADYVVVEDAVQTVYADGREWYRIVVSFGEPADAPGQFVFEINPDTYGPLFFDSQYAVHIDANGQTVIQGTEALPVTANNQDGEMWIDTIVTADNVVSNVYSWHFFFDESVDLEETVQLLLTSFVFLN